MHIALDRLIAHPGNANVVPQKLMGKLARHIGATGQYPPLIVRPHPDKAAHYQILDGHHRAEVLRRLGHAEARCEVWEVDDDRAAMLLLTLNRLHGADDPQRRGALLEQVTASIDLKAVAALISDDARQIRKLIECSHTPPPLPKSAPPSEQSIPEAVTFFLTPTHRERLLGRLRPLSRNRSEALVKLLVLDQASEAPHSAADCLSDVSASG